MKDAPRIAQLECVRGEGDVVGVVAPIGGVAQVIFHGSPGCRGRVCRSECIKTEERKKTGKDRVEVEREVEENQGQQHMCDMWMKMTDSRTT